MEKETCVCSKCGCVFDGNGENKEGLVCPECGSEQVLVIDEKNLPELPDEVSSGWDSTLLEEYFDFDETASGGSEKEISSKKTKVKAFIGKTVGFFKGNIDKFKEKYNQSDLMSKIASVAKKAGASTVYHALLLYYALTSNEVPATKKVIVIAALGYFIAPVDFIPDFVLMGLIDDGSVLLFAINQIMPYITDEIKAKALAKLNEWFGKSEIVSIKSKLLPAVSDKEAKTIIEEVEIGDDGKVIEVEILEEKEIEKKDDSDIKKLKNMEVFAPYQELNEYVVAKFNQPISLSYVSEHEVKVSYTKHVLFKDRSIGIDITIEQVTADSILVSYSVGLGIDTLVGGVLSFLTDKFPELSAGIHPEEGHRIRVNLSEIEKAKALVENIALRYIKADERGLRIGFGLKA